MLEIKNVHKTFNKGTINEKKALNGVNLQDVYKRQMMISMEQPSL